MARKANIQPQAPDAASSAASPEARGAAPAPPTDGGPARSALPSARMRLDPDQVVVGDRLRPVVEAKVQALMVSYRETGELPPIITRPLDLSSDRPTVLLVAGAHRREACSRLGVKVDCIVRDMTDVQARLVECDENLLGPDLDPFTRATFIAARLDAWSAQFPDRITKGEDGKAAPKRGRPSNSANLAEFPLGMGFAAETAADIGLSEKTVRNALAIHRGLSPAARQRLPNTPLARNEGLLRQLAGIADAAEQAQAIEALLEGRAKSVPEARAIVSGVEVTPPRAATEDPSKALRTLWKAASQTDREAMLRWLAGQKLPGGFQIVERADG